MSTSDLQAWFYVDLTLINISSGATTTIKLCNRPILDDTSRTFWPLLKAITGLGVQSAGPLPSVVTGQLVIDNSENSYAWERKFSDLLQNWTPVDQAVKIYTADTSLEDLDVSADFVKVWEARARGFRLSVEAQEVSIEIETDLIPRHTVTKRITSEDFTDAPSRSIGSHLSFALGSSVETKAYLVDAEGATSPDFAYATTLGSQFVTGGVNTFKLKNGDGDYIDVVSAASTSTQLFGQDTGDGTPASAASGSNPTAASDIFCTDLPAITTNNYAITQGYLYFYDSVSSPQGFFNFYLIEGDSTDGLPNRIIASGRVDKADQSFNNDNSQDKIEFTFENIVPLNVGTTYYFGWSQQSENSTLDHECVEDQFATQNLWRSENGRSWSEHYLGTFEFFWGLYGLVMTDDTSPTSAQINSEGLGHNYFTVTQKSAPSGLTNPDASALDWVVNIDGTLDDSSGNISGSASSVLDATHHILDLLTYTWNGSAWVSGVYSANKYSATHTEAFTSGNLFYRAVAGRSAGRAFASDILRSVCYESGSKVAIFDDTNLALGLYAWGDTLSSSAEFTEAEAQIISATEFGVESVVNAIDIVYDLRLANLELEERANEGDLRQYAGSLKLNSSTGGKATALSSQSTTNFGSRFLDNIRFNWLNDSTSATSIGYYFMINYDRPQRFVTLEVHYFGVDEGGVSYNSLDLFDVIEISHPDLPAYYGTSFDSRLPHYDGDPVDPYNGGYNRRAQRYKAQIEGKEILLNENEQPKLRFRARLLLNPNDPTAN